MISSQESTNKKTDYHLRLQPENFFQRLLHRIKKKGLNDPNQTKQPEGYSIYPPVVLNKIDKVSEQA